MLSVITEPANKRGEDSFIQYDREFLIKLQFDELSLSKPPNMPKMEIVKDEPITRRDTQRSSFDFVPSFVKSTTSRQGGIGKRTSKSGKDAGPNSQKPVRIIQIPSFSQEVALHKAENALSVKKSKNDKQANDELEDLNKKVLAILNKPTRSKFEIEKLLSDLTIDTEVKLQNLMELIFEKAVDEPSFSAAYAGICKTLEYKQVPTAEATPIGPFVKFRKLLLNRVQVEFNKDYMDSVDKAGYDRQMADPNLSEEEKKQVKAVYEASEMKARRRSLGNIRFIGELYKLKMLTVKIMHECVVKLLNSKLDEESLECLCRLLTTVGQEFERETNQYISNNKDFKDKWNISNYFDEMKKIIGGRKTSARVRFIMQDVVDLRQNNWQKRREDAGPKTIEEIHKDIEKEQLQTKLNMYAPTPAPPRRDDPRKRSQKSSMPPQSSDSDGWQMQRAAKNTLERVDTSKIRNISSNKVDIETMQLGPARGGGNWGKGSSGPRSSSRQEQPDTTSSTNRFASLSSAADSGGRDAYEGRTSFGRQGGGGSRPGSYVGRGSRGQSVENDRAKALQAVKNMNPGGRSTSTMLPPAPPRGDSGGGRSASMMAAPQPPKAELPLLGSADTDEDVLKKGSTVLLEEFLNVCDFKEAYQCVSEKFHPATIHAFVLHVYDHTVELSVKKRENAGALLSNLVKKRMLTESAYLKGLAAFLEFADDLIVDIPR